jgi:hypothetical protein
MTVILGRFPDVEIPEVPFTGLVLAHAVEPRCRHVEASDRPASGARALTRVTPLPLRI